MHDFQMTILFGTTNFPKDSRPENDGKPTLESVHQTVSRISKDRSPDQGSSSTTWKNKGAN